MKNSILRKAEDFALREYGKCLSELPLGIASSLISDAEDLYWQSMDDKMKDQDA